MLYFVQVLFHIGGKFRIHYVGEISRNQAIDYHPQFGRHQSLFQAQDIFSFEDCGYNRRVCARPADSEVFEGLYERCFRISWRRLRKVLLRLDSQKVEGLAFG